MPFFKHRLFRPICLVVLAFLLSACEGEINRNDNAYGDEPQPVTNELDNNDDFFHAFALNQPAMGSSNSHPDSLSETDLVDYFVIDNLSDTQSYRTYHYELKNLTGDADLELYNAYSGKESWSENNGLEDEKIDYWRGYLDYRNDFVFLKVINRSGASLDYTLEVY